MDGLGYRYHGCRSCKTFHRRLAPIPMRATTYFHITTPVFVFCFPPFLRFYTITLRRRFIQPFYILTNRSPCSSDYYLRTSSPPLHSSARFADHANSSYPTRVSLMLPKSKSDSGDASHFTSPIQYDTSPYVLQRPCNGWICTIASPSHLVPFLSLRKSR